jgi:hypothetical protein
VRAQAGVDARGAQVVGEGRPARGGGQAERRQPLLAERRLGDRREHPGGDERGPRADRVALVNDDPQPALRGTPRDAEPDRPRADDGYIETALGLCGQEDPSLRRHDPDQVQRSAAGVPPSQPGERAPVRCGPW